MSRTDRTIATILAELAEVRRHLREAPPHHDGGTAALRGELDRLEAELARARDRLAREQDGSGSA